MTLCLLTAMSSALIVETASLKNFLLGRETNTQYDNWVSHLAEGIAVADYNLYAPYDVQTTGFGDFRIPNVTELLYWNNMLDLFSAGDYGGADAVLTSAGMPYQIVEFHDTDTNRVYYIIREIPNASYYDDNDTFDTYDDETGAFAYGWGIFIYNPEGTKPVMITVPHPCDDFPTPALGYQALTTWDAKCLLINGAGREVRWTNEGSYTNSKSISDPTRYALHPFQLVYTKVADKIRDEFGVREFSAQIHAYDWDRHLGFANCQISAGNPRLCPNLPIRDLSVLKHDLLNAGNHLMIPENTIGIHRPVYLNDYYGVNYDTHPFTFDDGVNNYPVNDYIDLPAYTQNQQMLYTQSGTTDFDVYDPFFHMEMDELPASYDGTVNTYKWFYGWNEAEQAWDMNNLFTNFLDYYSLWIDDLEPVLVETFNMNDGMTPTTPTNLAVLNQSLNSVTLSWTKSSDYDFDSYEVLYGIAPIGLENYQIFNRTNASFLASQGCESITVPNLDNANLYYFRLRATDKNGNVSDLSNEVNSILAPANITSFRTWGMDDTVRLLWNVSGQTNNQGFSVYRKDNPGAYALQDSWQTNPALVNPSSSQFEWWDTNVANGLDYTYKISSTNLNNIEFDYNYPSSASPQPIHYVSIRNNSFTLADSIAFGTNPYAGDGQDLYWDTTKTSPVAPYVWNAFWEQYWGSTGTSLSRELKSAYDLDGQLKTWIMRVASDQINETLSISASDNFDRSEKLYLLDGGNGAYHNLLSGPYQYVNANSNIRTMTLFWGNMQPKAFISSQPNRIYQGGSSMNLFWNYQYPFLIDHIAISIQNATDSLLVSSMIPNNQFSYSFTLSPNLTEMQDCRVAVDVYAVDGVVTRFWSSYHFSLVPYMNLAFNMEGWRTRTNPWLNSDLNFEQVYGTGAFAYTRNTEGDWVQTTDYDFGNAYWVYCPDFFFYSNTLPVQTEEYSVALAPGWNFVPNPHLCAYDIEDISFYLNGNLFRYSELLSQRLVSRAVYVFRDGKYEAVTRIEPYEALFIKFYGSADMVPTIRFYPFDKGPEIEPSAADWELKVSATQSGKASVVKLGMHPNATSDYDFEFDLPKPLATPFPMAKLWFQVAEGDTTALEHHVSTDIREPFTEPEQGAMWTLYLQVSDTEPVTFNFDQLGVPEGWQIKVILGDEHYYLDSTESFVWTPPAASTYIVLIQVTNYVVANDDPVQAMISKLTAYPNPFNPDVNISFSLSAPSNVQVSVYNIKGQKVTDLVDEELRGGKHTLLWNGKDSTGRGVGSGIYFARVHAKNKTQIIKMILMK